MLCASQVSAGEPDLAALQSGLCSLLDAHMQQAHEILINVLAALVAQAWTLAEAGDQAGMVLLVTAFRAVTRAAWYSACIMRAWTAEGMLPGPLPLQRYKVSAKTATFACCLSRSQKCLGPCIDHDHPDSQRHAVAMQQIACLFRDECTWHEPISDDIPSDNNLGVGPRYKSGQDLDAVCIMHHLTD